MAVDEYFDEVNLKTAKVPMVNEDINCILHTQTDKYVVGALGIEQTAFSVFNVTWVIHREHYLSDEEYRQVVLEEFEDAVSDIEASGCFTDFETEAI